MNHYKAEEYARKLSLAGGGWRLPTREELRSLYDESKPSGADPKVNVGNKWVWTSELEQPSKAWVFDFNMGDEYSVARGKSDADGRVLAVRSLRSGETTSSSQEKNSSPQASERFTLKDGVIYDSKLGLQWAPASGQAVNHYEAESMPGN